MGRKPLGWTAIVSGILGVLLFAILIAATLLAQRAVTDWANGYLEPADRAIVRLGFRLTQTERRTATAEDGVTELIATGADRLLEAARSEVVKLQMDLVALEASIMSVDSGMEIIAALPLFSDERRGFKETVAGHLAALREELAQVEFRLAKAQSLAAEIRAGGDAAEKARAALRALARELAPEIAAIRAFLTDLGHGLIEVRENLATAYDRIDHGLTVVTVVLCFVFAWLAIAHFCVYLAGKRLLEEEALVNSGEL